MAHQTHPPQFWTPIERFLGTLPPPLFEQAVLLKNQLAIEYSDSGQFVDIFSRDHDHPLLYLHRWLADDLELPLPPALPQQLFAASLFAFASAYLQRRLLAEPAACDQSDSLLAQTLAQQSDFYLAQQFAGASSLWAVHHSCWQTFAAAALSALPASLPETLSLDDPASLETVRALASGRWAFAKISTAAVAIASGLAAEIPAWGALIDQFNAIFQMQRELIRIKPAVMQRRYSPTLFWAIRQAGLDPSRSLAPERVLGALVLSGVLPELCQQLQAQLALCRQAALASNLVTFEAYLAGWQPRLQQLQSLFDLRFEATTPASSSTSGSPPAVALTPHRDALATATQTAEAYLLADLTFRESWEVQRGLIPGRPEITASAFPSGLIIEALCRCGHSLPDQIGHLFETLHANDFRYYDYPELPPDADDLGLLLRLFQYSAASQRPRHQQMLQEPLAWLAASVQPSGEIPVWFATEKETQKTAPEPVVWGGSCATTEINLLLGLLAYDWAGYRPLIEASAGSVFQRFEQRGLGATLYYQPPYIIWATLSLIETLLARLERDTALARQLQQSRSWLLAQFEREISRPLVTPQRAAFFLLTSRLQAAQYFFDSRWISRLVGQQRHDGSWAAESLFLIPHRRGSAWYASRSVTTAFCYRALKGAQER